MQIGEDAAVSMTRGDTEELVVEVTDAEGNPVQLVSADTATLTVRRRRRADADVILELEGQIDGSTITFSIPPEATQAVAAGRYVYDVEVVGSIGTKTVVGGGETDATFTLWQDVTQHG